VVFAIAESHARRRRPSRRDDGRIRQQVALTSHQRRAGEFESKLRLFRFFLRSFRQRRFGAVVGRIGLVGALERFQDAPEIVVRPCEFEADAAGAAGGQKLFVLHDGGAVGVGGLLESPQPLTDLCDLVVRLRGVRLQRLELGRGRGDLFIGLQKLNQNGNCIRRQPSGLTSTRTPLTSAGASATSRAGAYRWYRRLSALSA